MKEINENNKSFEDIKHIDENGVEFWYGRELMPVLQYSNWQNFEKIIDKALKERVPGNRVAIIFKEDTVPKELSSIRDRYACNVIDMNHSEISKDQVNLVRVRYVKGIEFDEVIVLDSGKMEREEKYIAYTRALTKLTVIHIGGNTAK